MYKKTNVEAQAVHMHPDKADLPCWSLGCHVCKPEMSPTAQVIARIHTNQVVVRKLIHSLLVRIGRHHPQALMYPLLVACKSQSTFRRSAAQHVVDNLRQHSAQLVDQASLVRFAEEG